MHKTNDIKLDVDYADNFISDTEADILFEQLMRGSTSSSRRNKKIFGDIGKKYVIQFRDKVAEYQVLPWTPQLLSLKHKIEQVVDVTLTVCVVSIYPTKKVGIAAHRDKEMVPGTRIVGLSLGDTRTLRMTNRSKTKNHDIVLHHASIYVINPPTNDNWAHEILPGSNENEEDGNNKGNGARICITFRNY